MIRATSSIASVILLTLFCDVLLAQEDARGLDPIVVEQIESIVRRGIADGEMPGAVVVVANRERVLYQQALGDCQIEPTRQPMTIDTVFDLASLTKPVATATSVMRLVGEGKLDVDQTRWYVSSRVRSQRQRQDHGQRLAFARWRFDSRQCASRLPGWSRTSMGTYLRIETSLRTRRKVCLHRCRLYRARKTRRTRKRKNA